MAVNCSMTWNTFKGDIPEPLMQFFLYYCCVICVVGTICNLVALWCVVSCPRTNPSVKVLLCALFSTTLLMCLVVMPFMAHLSLGKLWCDRDASKPVLRVLIHTYVVLTQMELLYIFVMALLRALAVWVPQRGHLKLRTGVAVAVGVGLYNSSMTALTAAAFWRQIIPRPTRFALLKVYYGVHFLLPVVLTLACYLSTIVAVRRNKSKLASSRHAAAVTQVVDEATRAMLAVFISNLLFGLPHSIYHIIPFDYRVFSYVVMHSIFFTHLYTDPLVFVYFNQHHRRRVLQALKFCFGRSSPSKEATSAVSSHVTQSSSALKSFEEERDKDSLPQ
ncbi:uncharacterized protein LOC126984068 [Eriocheir sinensis]|uniref:uncharacterized protein LOC126984068 n=1 Tax=Eriocheir sinensis TaxID=95602 RepID=UPI0021C65A0D|nr:uncharacterized protein LOC126984068 [Eriocheir sinensis]XP_050693422.1 uncharacterized protein LOC126984068 [Eriocheir sinensis]